MIDPNNKEFEEMTKPKSQDLIEIKEANSHEQVEEPNK